MNFIKIGNQWGNLKCGVLRKRTADVLFEGESVIPIGFEPMTYSLEGCRSIQLSYGTLNRKSVAKIIFFSLHPSSQPEKNGSKYCTGVETGFKGGI